MKFWEGIVRVRSRQYIRLFLSRALCIFLLLFLLMQCAYLGLRSYCNRLIIPAVFIHKINNKLIPYGIMFAVRQASLDLKQGILSLENPSLMLTSSRKPLMLAHQVNIDLSLSSFLLGHMGVDGIDVKEAALYCPALYSPSGERELLIDKISGSIYRDYNGWHVDSILAKVNNLTLVIQGEGLPSFSEMFSGDSSLDACQMHRSYKLFCEQIFILSNFSRFATSPILEVNLQGDFHGILHTAFHLAASRYEKPQEFEFNEFWCKGRVTFNGYWSLDGPIVGYLSSAQCLNNYEAGPSWISLDFEKDFTMKEVNCHITDATAYHTPVGSVYAELGLTNLPILEGFIRVTQDNKWADFKGTINIKQGTAQGFSGGTCSPEDLYDHIASLKKVDFIKDCHFEEAFNWQADVDVGPEWAFNYIDLKVQSGPASLLGLSLSALDAEAILTKGMLYIQNMSLWTKGFSVTGSYQHNWETHDYRFLLDGTIEPTILNAWLPPWWTELWDEFLFQGILPRANIDIQGKWNDPHKRLIFGKAEGQDFTFRGVAVSQCNLNLYAVPLFLGIYDLELKNETDVIRGNLEWLYKQHSGPAYAITFDAQGICSLSDLNAFLGKEIAQVTAPFECAQPPYIEAKGYLLGAGSSHPGQAYLAVSGKFSKPFTYNKFPLNALCFQAVHAPQKTEISNLEGEIANGKLQGRISVFHEQQPSSLAFDLNIQGASYAQLTSLWHKTPALEEFRGKDFVEHKPSRKKQDLEEGLLDLSLQGHGRIGDFKNFEGIGSFHLYETSLGKIRLFGLLSHLLEVPLFGVGSFALNELKTEFSFGDGVMTIPHLEVWGPTAKMEGVGSYDLLTDKVKFEVNFYLLEQLKIPFLSQALHFLKPVTNVLQASLSGTLENPVWSPVINPFNVFKPRSLRGQQKTLHSRLDLP